MICMPKHHLRKRMLPLFPCSIKGRHIGWDARVQWSIISNTGPYDPHSKDEARVSACWRIKGLVWYTKNLGKVWPCIRSGVLCGGRELKKMYVVHHVLSPHVRTQLSLLLPPTKKNINSLVILVDEWMKKCIFLLASAKKASFSGTW